MEEGKREISSHSYRSTETELNFHKYGNVIWFEGSVLLHAAVKRGAVASTSQADYESRKPTFETVLTRTGL